MSKIIKKVSTHTSLVYTRYEAPAKTAQGDFDLSRFPVSYICRRAKKFLCT